MNPSHRLEIENACRSLSHAFGYHLDRKDFVRLADQFADTGVWIRLGVRLTGHSEIIDAMNARPSNQLTRHLTTNVHFTELGPDHAHGVVSYISYFASDADTLPLTLRPDQAMVIDFHDTYIRTAGGWKIDVRETQPVFVPESMRAIP